MFASLRIGARLAAGFAAVLLVTLVMGFVGLYNTGRFSGQVVSLGNHTKAAAYLADAQSAIWQLRWDVAQFIAIPDPQERRKLADNGPPQQRIVEENLARFEQLPGHGTEELEAVREVRTHFSKYMEARPKWFELYGSGNLQEAAEFRARTITVFGGATVKALANLIALQRAQSDQAKELAARSTAQSRAALVVLLGVVLVASAAVAWAITRSITRPLAQAVEVAQQVAKGNLAVHIDVRSRDETGRLMQALSRMRDDLATAVDTIRASAETVGIASREIAAGSTEMSTRIEQQAASLEESASSMEELTTAVKRNTENAGRANELAVGASDVAGQGGEAMSQVIATMGGIAQSSRRIADITAVIDGIAFQTNILALNAAVEAARAGDQGRGFAVVASEVRSLAQRCASAAKEIKALIEESAHRVDGGTRLVEGTGRTMEEIVRAVDQLKAIMAGICTASREQLAGIEQVGHAVTQMDRMTQQNAALVTESASAAEHMATQAQQLVDVVARFRLASRGAPSPAASQVTAPVPPPSSTEVKKPRRQKALVQPAPALAMAGEEEWREF